MPGYGPFSRPYKGVLGGLAWPSDQRPGPPGAPIAPGGIYYAGSQRGRKPMVDENGMPKMNYYHAIRASTVNP